MASVPFTFVPDTVADANQVNSNFQAVANPAGPLGVGTTPPANAQPGVLFVNNAVNLVPRSSVAGGDEVGHIAVNAYVNTSGVWTYLTNGPAFHLVANEAAGANQVWAFRQAPAGTAGAPVAWQRTVSFAPGVVMVDPVSIIQPGGDQVGHFMVNALFSATAGNWVYFADGPAFDFVCDATTQLWAFRQAPPGTANTPITWTRIAGLDFTPPAGSTNFSLLTNNAGTITLQAVLLGAAGTGPGGAGRMLYVPN